MAEGLHVNGEFCDPDDLTYREKREVRRLVRKNWEEDIDGEFGWDKLTDDNVIPATIAVFMQREKPDTPLEELLEDALDMRERDVMPTEAVPPTVADLEESLATS